MREHKIQLVLRGMKVSKEEIEELLIYCISIKPRKRKLRHEVFIENFSKKT